MYKKKVFCLCIDVDAHITFKIYGMHKRTVDLANVHKLI